MVRKGTMLTGYRGEGSDEIVEESIEVGVGCHVMRPDLVPNRRARRREWGLEGTHVFYTTQQAPLVWSTYRLDVQSAGRAHI